MNRREFIQIAGGAMTPPLAASAQQPNAPVIGFLGSANGESFADMITTFRRGLDETGYVEGKNVSIEYQWAEGRYERLPALAAELVAHRVEVIVAVGGDGPALAAKFATSDIPVIFVSGGEPLKAGLVKSLAHPGGNVTGVNFIAASLMAKRLELLQQLIPKHRLIGALVNPTYPDSALQERELNEAAETRKQAIEFATASTEREIESAFVKLVKAGTDALLVANDPFFYAHPEMLVGLAARHGLPTFYFERAFVAAGGLVSYGASLSEAFRQAGIYTGRVLAGVKPGDLPVLQPTAFELVINLKTAKALQLSIPPSLLARADEVIE